MKSEDKSLNDFDRKALVSSLSKYNVINMIYCNSPHRFNSYIVFYKINGFILSRSFIYRSFIDSKEKRISNMMDSIIVEFESIFEKLDKNYLLNYNSIEEKFIVSVANNITHSVDNILCDCADIGLIDFDPDDFDIDTHCYLAEELLSEGKSAPEVFELFINKFDLFNDNIIKQIESL